MNNKKFFNKKQHDNCQSAGNDRNVEFSFVSIFLGIILSIFFGAANAYLGLRSGLTISASVPAAVISMTIMRIVLKKKSILENNMVQTIASAGESIAGGIAFTLPAWFLWAKNGVLQNISIGTITIIAICGGVLGVLFMIPLRKEFVSRGPNSLKYPEGLACAQVLKVGEDTSSIKYLFSGLSISCLIGFLADMFKVFSKDISHSITYGIPGKMGVFNVKKITTISAEASPALIGVGYICNIGTASRMLAGAVLAWLILVPFIIFIGQEYNIINLFDRNEIRSICDIDIDVNGDLLISELSDSQISKFFTKYIGAGAMATGGVISIIKSLPNIKNSLYTLIMGNHAQSSDDDSDKNQDLEIEYIVLGVLSVVGLMYFYLGVDLKWILLTLCFGFAFTVISSQIVGMCGATNCPISGMTILTVIVFGILLSFSGREDADIKKTVIIIGAMISTIAAIAGDTSQDLKTGLEVGATPRRQQIGEIIGVVASSLFVGITLYLLDSAFVFGSKELGAPQASLIKTIIDSVVNLKFHVELILIGAMFAICFELLGIGAIPVAIGMYLPFSLSLTIMFGGILRYIVDCNKNKTNKNMNACVDDSQCEEDDIEEVESSDYGVLFSAGLITGEGLIGIIMALYSAIGWNISDGVLLEGQIYPIIMIVIILASLLYVGIQKKKEYNKFA